MICSSDSYETIELGEVCSCDDIVFNEDDFAALLPDGDYTVVYTIGGVEVRKVVTITDFAFENIFPEYHVIHFQLFNSLNVNIELDDLKFFKICVKLCIDQA